MNLLHALLLGWNLAYTSPLSPPKTPVSTRRVGTIELNLDNVTVAIQKVSLPKNATSQAYTSSPIQQGSSRKVGHLAVTLRTVRTLSYRVSLNGEGKERVKYRELLSLQYPQLRGDRWAALNQQLKKRFLAAQPRLLDATSGEVISKRAYQRATYKTRPLHVGSSLKTRNIDLFVSHQQPRVLIFTNEEENCENLYGCYEPVECESLYIDDIYYDIRRQRFVAPAQVLRKKFCYTLAQFAIHYLTVTQHLTVAEQKRLWPILLNPLKIYYILEGVNRIVLCYCDVYTTTKTETKKQNIHFFISPEVVAQNILD